MTAPKFETPAEFYLVTYSFALGFGRGWTDWLQSEIPFCRTMLDAEGEIASIKGTFPNAEVRVLHASSSGVQEVTDEVLEVMAAKWADEYLPHEAQPLPAYLAKHLPSYAEAAE